jgi:exonuclease VII small subunit
MTRAGGSSAEAAGGGAMRVVHGRVEQGHVVLDESLPEGSDVAVIVAAGDEAFDLDEQQVAELRASIEEADRGEFVPLDDVLKSR